jgi:hypothetical protein
MKQKHVKQDLPVYDMIYVYLTAVGLAPGGSSCFLAPIILMDIIVIAVNVALDLHYTSMPNINMFPLHYPFT